MAERQRKGRNIVPGTKYRGGITWTRPRQQFQCLYALTGTYSRALELSADLVAWPKGQPMPEESHLRDWCQQFDDSVNPPSDRLMSVMRKRRDAFFDDHVRRVIEGNAKASLAITRKITSGEIDVSLSPLLQHANNGVGFNYEKLTASRKIDASPVQRARKLGIGAGPPPKQLEAPKGKKEKIVEGEFRVLEEVK